MNACDEGNPSLHALSILETVKLGHLGVLNALGVSILYVILFRLLNVRPLYECQRHHKKGKMNQIYIQGIYHGSSVIELVFTNMDVLFLFLN